MSELIPVQGNPFSTTPSTSAGASLVPVQGNPFDTDKPEVGSSLVPVEGDPFKAGTAEAAPEAPATPVQMPQVDEAKQATLSDAFLRGIDLMQSNLYAGTEAIGEATGSETLKTFGQEGRVRNIEEAKAYPQRQEFLKAKSFDDFLQATKETIGELIPMTAPTIGGAVAGGAIGTAIAPGPGTAIGAVLGGVAPSFVMGAGEVQSAIKEKGGEQAEAPGFALGGGAAIAALDTILPAKIGAALVKRFGTDAAGEIAKTALMKPVNERFVNAVAKGFAIEGITEAVQEAIQEVAASGGLDRRPDWSGLPAKMLEAGISGAIGGGLLGGGANIISRGGSEKAGLQPSDEFLNEALRGLTTESIQYTPPTSQMSMPEAQEMLMQEIDKIRAQPGADTARLAKLLGPKLYGEPTELPNVSIKEMFQNGFDAVKGKIEQLAATGSAYLGKIDVETDPVERTISLTDNGTGMRPQTLAKEFLQIAGTSKETTQASGGLGIAKMLVVFANESLEVTTLRDGIVSTLKTSGDKVLQALSNPERSIDVQTRRLDQMAASERQKVMKMFPDGSGTKVTVKIPKSYREPSSGTMKEIEFPDEFKFLGSRPLKNSPLFHDIDVRFNGQRLPIGTKFPKDKFTPFANVEFDWGSARILVSREKDEMETYGNNLHVLSNGLWQFSGTLKKDPLKTFGPNIPRAFYIDVSPKVAAEDVGYPFDLNRQQFTQQAKNDFGKIFNYITTLYQQIDFGTSTRSFGAVQYLKPQGGQIVATEPVVLKPRVPTRPTPANSLNFAQNEIEIKNGRFIANGREVPVLTMEDLEKVQVNVDELLIPQEEIDANSVIIHDNVEIRPIGANDYTSLVEIARKQYGKAFDEFAFGVGDVFRRLRDAVVESMVDEVGQNTYLPLSTEGIGVSFDERYRGVSIKVPFSGMFLNPTRPEYTDYERAALGFYGTMIHELAHFKVRSHDADFPAEMQRILINTEHVREGFIKELRAITRKHEAMLKELINVLDTNDKRAIGDRFKDSGEFQERDGRPLEDVGRSGEGAESAGGVPSGVESSRSEAQGVGQSRGVSTEAERLAKGIRENQRAMAAVGDKHFPATPPAPETALPKMLMDEIGPTPEGKASKAAADRFSWGYKFMLSLVQVADRNLHIPFLQRYRELWQIKQLERANIMNDALATLKSWRKLGKTQSDSVAQLIDDYSNMRYLRPEEVAQGIARKPTQAELSKMVRDNKVSTAGVEVFKKVVADFRLMLMRYRELLLREADKISNPAAKALREAEIQALIQQLDSIPYFPSMWFGPYTLTIRDKSGTVVFFSTFESKRERDRAFNKMERTIKTGETIQQGYVAESIRPLVGMPPGLLDQISQKLNLSPEQQAALEQLRYEMAPAQGFRRHFLPKKRIAGYSTDFMRAYASYFFHGSNYFTNLKYIEPMKAQIYLTRDSAKSLRDGTNRDQIANFMQNHLDYMMNPKADWASLRAMTFLWALGFSPAAATLNLSQLVVGSYPFLASKFGGVGLGDARAVKAISNASRKLSTYYKRGTLEKSGASAMDLKALSEGIKEGILTEAMAPELAAISEGRNLGKGFGGNLAERTFSHVMEWSSLMFELAEQTNRRVTFRAAWQLALENPNIEYVRENVKKHSLTYERLRREGWDPMHSAAFVTAKDATEATQYIYQQYAQPKLLQGRLRTVFIFKSFIQNTLFMMWNYPAAGVRSFLIMAALGGLMGVPGAEDLRGIIKALGFRLFGKDWDVEDQARRFALDVMNGVIPPDILLHGMARRGFGLPAVMEGLGVPFPTFDRSRAIGLGQVLPVDAGVLLGPSASRDQSRAMSDSMQKASGAAFGVWFNMFKALTDGQLDPNDMYRWMKAMPRALGSASKAYKAMGSELDLDKGFRLNPDAAVRNRAGNAVVRYDVTDPREMAEIIGMALGYQPLRLSAQWDRIIAEREAIAFWDIRREAILRQLWAARRTNDKEEYQQALGAVRNFNEQARKEEALRGKVITADTIQQSFQARARAQNAQESGMPARRADVPLVRDIQRLYPEAQVDVRRTR